MRVKGFMCRQGVSLQLWQGLFPHTVFTVWFFRRPFRIKPRLYFWRGRRRAV